jgi:hypothetical protein
MDPEGGLSKVQLGRFLAPPPFMILRCALVENVRPRPDGKM